MIQLFVLYTENVAVEHKNLAWLRSTLEDSKYKSVSQEDASRIIDFVAQTQFLYTPAEVPVFVQELVRLCSRAGYDNIDIASRFAQHAQIIKTVSSRQAHSFRFCSRLFIDTIGTSNSDNVLDGEEGVLGGGHDGRIGSGSVGTGTGKEGGGREEESMAVVDMVGSGGGGDVSAHTHERKRASTHAHTHATPPPLASTSSS